MPVLEGLADRLAEDIRAESEKAPVTVKAPKKLAGDTPASEEITKKRAELVKLSEDGEITHSVSYIKKASGKVVEKLCAEVEAKRLEKAEAFLTDMIISRFSDLLGGLNAVESSDSLNQELQKDEL